MLVSVIMPAYNAGQYLKPAVSSILAQTFTNLELILIDDGSTDGSVDQLRMEVGDSRLRILRQPNCGKPASMNRGIDEARGEAIAVMDADDEAHPRRIEFLANAIQLYPHIAAVLSGFELIIDGRHVAPISFAKDESQCGRDISAYCMPGHDPTICVRTDVAKEIRFDESLRFAEGYDFILRIGERYDLRVLPDVLYYYRIHQSSSTKTDILTRIGDRNRAVREACKRRGLDPDKHFPREQIDEIKIRTRHRENGLNNLFTDSVRTLKRRGYHYDALLIGLRSAIRHPLDADYYKPIAYALMPASIAEWLRPLESRIR